MTEVDTRTFDENGVLTDAVPAPLRPVQSGCFWCAAEGEHRQEHETRDQVPPHVRVGLTLARWLEEQGYASPNLAELGTAAVNAVSDEDYML